MRQNNFFLFILRGKCANQATIEAVDKFPNAAHVYGIPMWGVWAPTQDMDGHMASHSQHYHHRHFPRFVKVGWNPTWCKCANHATTILLRLWNLSNCIHVHGISIWGVWAPSLLRIWIGIWLHNHIITTTDASPCLWKLAEILPDTSVQTMPLQFGWGCGTFQIASHVHAIPIWGVGAPSQDVDGHMASHSNHYNHRCFPRFVRVGWNPTWCKCANHTTMLWLRL